MIDLLYLADHFLVLFIYIFLCDIFTAEGMYVLVAFVVVVVVFLVAPGSVYGMPLDTYLARS